MKSRLVPIRHERDSNGISSCIRVIAVRLGGMGWKLRLYDEMTEGDEGIAQSMNGIRR